MLVFRMAATELTLRIRVLRGADIIIGPGRADRQMNMSYKRAWELVEAMNAGFATPLVAAAKGGAGGGGARLTETGQAVLSAYRAIQSAATQAAQPGLATLFDALSVPPDPETG
jgi:molybdate transport system regulatory protein